MTADQTETVTFLSTPAAFGGAPQEIETVETHGALVFLGRDEALKLKRAVHYDYMDLRTPAKRRAMLEREFALNHPVAPSVYRDVQPVTREANGRLALGGRGEPVDWVLRMRRFPAEDEFTAIAARGALDDALAMRTGRALAAFHAAAPERRQPGAPLIAAILDELGRVFSTLDEASAIPTIASWREEARASLERLAPLLDRRGQDGHVRGAHGDLHLRNIVLIEGRPVPLDALEFDETLRTCDLLYDLGFLLMDLVHRDLARAACRILDSWLLALGGGEDGGLAALPLFLSVRAAIRAMVLLQTDTATGHADEGLPEAARYMAEARAFLAPPPPRLIAVGGFSGTGKSVLARALAPGLGAAPGAVLLSSDATRKAGRDVAGALPDAAYDPAARGAVYDVLEGRARTILAAGHSAVVDATFLDPARREAVSRIAAELGVPFAGLWLEAPRDVLEARVRGRRGDLSDADVTVLHGQLAAGTGPLDWARVPASGTPDETLAAAAERLGSGEPDDR